MKTRRSFRLAFLASLLVACASLSLGGCGEAEDKKVVAVDPQFQKKTNDMLKQMRTDAMEKSKKLTGRKH